MGLRVVSVELEPRFIGWSYESFYLHLDRWQRHGHPLPMYLQGDSRRFAEIVGPVAGVLASPPYAETGSGGEKTAGMKAGLITRQRLWEAGG